MRRARGSRRSSREAEQLPDVDVADGDELGEADGPVGGTEQLEVGGEDTLAPPPVVGAAELRAFGEEIGVLLLGEQAQGEAAVGLVVLGEVLGDSREVADRGEGAGPVDAARGDLAGPGEDAVPVAVVAQDGLDGDAGALGDGGEGELAQGAFDGRGV